MPFLTYHISKDIKRYIALRRVLGKDNFILCYWKQISTASMEVSLTISRKIIKLCSLSQQSYFLSCPCVRTVRVRVAQGLVDLCLHSHARCFHFSSMSLNTFFVPVTVTLKLNLQLRDSCAL